MGQSSFSFTFTSFWIFFYPVQQKNDLSRQNLDGLLGKAAAFKYILNSATQMTILEIIGAQHKERYLSVTGTRGDTSCVIKQIVGYVC